MSTIEKTKVEKNNSLNTSKLKTFAQAARRQLLQQVEAKLKRVLVEGSLARRELPGAVAELEKQIDELSEKQVIEQAAYTWFNRFCALRFMDANRYTSIGVVSPAEGFTQPEILADAKQGVIEQDWRADTQRIRGLLDGSIPSDNAQGEAYQALLIAVCNHYHSIMPFMFEKIADWTELLIPDDLLSDKSIITQTRYAMTQEACQDVEVIGWLYQFYISEKKDDVFAALKKGKKITPENIPAATQLFTPHWIVRYLVENSLGRLWMLNHPDSRLIEQMDYYIKPEEPETDYLQINSPEEIKICDPACGSGHMLTYAFDLLYAIYEEQGYQASEIPKLILTHNLHGIEIDQRAGALAAFALTMKAREKHRRFLTSGKVVQPNICVLENISIDPEDLSAYMDKVGRDLFTDGLLGVVHQFEQADNFGSLIRPLVTDVAPVLELLRERKMGEDLFLAGVHQKVLTALRQADYLSPKYHVVVANPPYMGGKNINPELKKYATEYFPEAKSDLYAVFVERAIELVPKGSFVGLMTPFTWLFLSSFEALRHLLLESATLTSLVRPEYHAFFDSAYVPICAFTLFTKELRSFNGIFIDLNEFYGADLQSPRAIEAIRDPMCRWRFQSSTNDFRKITGIPIAYWVSGDAAQNCETMPMLKSFSEAKSGMSSCNSDLFLRQWYEVSESDVNWRATSHEDASSSNRKWFPYNKGGGNRRWHGYNDVLINWACDGAALKEFVTNNPNDPNTTHWSRRLFNLEYFFLEGLTWSAVTSSRFSCRTVPTGVIPGTGSKTLYGLPKSKEDVFLALLNSNAASYYLSIFSPTLNFEAGDVGKLPIAEVDAKLEIEELRSISKDDWDSTETACDFTRHVLLQNSLTELSATYHQLRESWRASTSKLQALEEANNAIFTTAYSLDGQIFNSVRLADVTLNCNPHYRYDEDKSDSELESLLLADTMREFISYAVGCMLGRYSLDKPGLILANQGETFEDYLRIVISDLGIKEESFDPANLKSYISNLKFAPDEDNVIPMLEGEWFDDDITERFKTFLKVTFSDENYEENLMFLEDALYPENKAGKKRKTIRDYFLKEFYSHHIKLYKKRPIYWLFSSPKGTFNALIYMHRYQPDTVSIVLNNYLREFHNKLTNKVGHLQSVADSADSAKAEKTKAIKQINAMKKQLKELEEYEREVLYQLATQQIEIDLDDGVKVNYNKFGTALKKVTGLTEK